MLVAADRLLCCPMNMQEYEAKIKQIESLIVELDKAFNSEDGMDEEVMDEYEKHEWGC